MMYQSNVLVNQSSEIERTCSLNVIIIFKWTILKVCKFVETMVKFAEIQVHILLLKYNGLEEFLNRRYIRTFFIGRDLGIST